MGNSVEYECHECHYWDAMHGIDGYSINDPKFKKCSHCTRPTRERLIGHGIYEVYKQAKEGRNEDRNSN
jgi:hypothetical protein